MAEKTNSNLLFANFNQDFSYAALCLVICASIGLSSLFLDASQLGREKGTMSPTAIPSGEFTR